MYIGMYTAWNTRAKKKQQTQRNNDSIVSAEEESAFSYIFRNVSIMGGDSGGSSGGNFI